MRRSEPNTLVHTSEYLDMIKGSLTMIATDEPYRLADAIVEDDRALNAYGG